MHELCVEPEAAARSQHHHHHVVIIVASIVVVVRRCVGPAPKCRLRREIIILRRSLLWSEEWRPWKSTSNVEVSAYPAGRTGSSDEKLGTADKKAPLTQMRTILTEKGVSEGKEGAYHARSVSLALATTMAQARPSATERGTPLTNERADEANKGTPFAG